MKFMFFLLSLGIIANGKKRTLHIFFVTQIYAEFLYLAIKVENLFQHLTGISVDFNLYEVILWKI